MIGWKASHPDGALLRVEFPSSYDFFNAPNEAKISIPISASWRPDHGYAAYFMKRAGESFCTPSRFLATLFCQPWMKLTLYIRRPETANKPVRLTADPFYGMYPVCESLLMFLPPGEQLQSVRRHFVHNVSLVVVVEGRPEHAGERRIEAKFFSQHLELRLQAILGKKEKNGCKRSIT